MGYDFSGYATRNNIRCSDGRTIMKDAFADDNGATVPLVYMHDHSGIDNVLGHAKLENREDGVYCYGSFNGSPQGKTAKELVKHGDIKGLSIYANHLTQQGGNVLHGQIREVSLVLAGANPGAFIDNVSIQHGDEVYPLDDEAVIGYSDDSPIELVHSEESSEKKKPEEDDKKDAEDQESDSTDESKDEASSDEESENEESKDETSEDEASEDRKKKKETSVELEHADDATGKTVADVWNTFTEKEKNVVYAIIGSMNAKGSMAQADQDTNDTSTDSGSEETVEDIFNAMSEEKKNVAYAIIGMAAEAGSDEENNDNNNASHSEEEGEIMHQNAFEQGGTEEETLSHAEQMDFMAQAKEMGSFRDYNEAALAHDQSYGIKNIDVLFPDAKMVNGAEPYLYKRDTEWVQTVLSGTRHTPFAKIKTAYADLTPEEARAKGFTLDRNSNHRKMDEVFSVYKRETTPQTVYKKQKLDRDDEIDITDFSVVNFLWNEMRVMLNEEIARDILIGDGRTANAEDHVNPTHIRPIAFDDDLYAIKVTAPADADMTTLVDLIRTSKVGYQGSGMPTLFIAPSLHGNLMVQRDKMGRRLYDTDASLAAAMGMAAIVEVPVMENLKASTDVKANSILAIAVNLRDYTVGTNKGGEISSFEDFDIDFNQHKYLLESRLSGALTMPKSAIVIEQAPKA